MNGKREPGEIHENKWTCVCVCGGGGGGGGRRGMITNKTQSQLQVVN